LECKTANDRSVARGGREIGSGLRAVQEDFRKPSIAEAAQPGVIALPAMLEAECLVGAAVRKTLASGSHRASSLGLTLSGKNFSPFMLVFSRAETQNSQPSTLIVPVRLRSFLNSAPRFV
jgi:hypothetical protein